MITKASPLCAILLLCLTTAFGYSGALTSLPEYSFQGQLSVYPITSLNNFYLAANRNWRLAQTRDQSNTTQVVNWIDKIRSDYVYNSSNPNQADTVNQFGYNASSNLWYPRYRIFNTWDVNGEYLLSQTWYPFAPLTAIIYTREYDDQNRLTAVYRDEFIDSTWINIIRINYVYNNGSLSSQHVFFNDYFEGITNYYRHIFSCDTLGRIIENYLYVSTDSLNWQPSMRYHYIYSPDDVSTGEDLIYNISHYNTRFLIFGSDDYGKLAEINSEVFNQNNWTWYDRTLYTYENEDHRITATSQTYYQTYWINTTKIISDYDLNMNLVNVETSSYNPMYGAWMPPNQRTLYIWENLTGIENETVPSITDFSLTSSPNPFVSSISLRFSSKQDSKIIAAVYNLKGQLVKNLGSYKKTIIWDGTDNNGKAIPTGVYLIRASQGNRTITSKVVNIR